MLTDPTDEQPPTIGGLFYGYGGLDQAVAQVFGARLVWYSDVCKIVKRPDGTYEVGHHSPHRGPCAIAAHHHPGVPNLGAPGPTCGWRCVRASRSYSHR